MEVIPEIVVPCSTDNIKKQIKALEYQISKDISIKDKSIHEVALDRLKLML